MIILVMLGGIPPPTPTHPCAVALPAHTYMPFNTNGFCSFQHEWFHRGSTRMVSVVFVTLDHSGHVLSMYPFMYAVAVMVLLVVWFMALLFWNWIVTVLSARMPDPTCSLRLVSVFFLDFISACCVRRFSSAVLASRPVQY